MEAGARATTTTTVSADENARRFQEIRDEYAFLAVQPEILRHEYGHHKKAFGDRVTPSLNHVVQQLALRHTLLERIDPASFLESWPKDDPEWEVPAKTLVGYSMTKLRKQKILSQQLQVVKFLLDFVVQADTASWAEEGSQEATRKELNEVKEHWKAIKEEYVELVEKVETTIPLLLGKLTQLQRKKALLEEALQQYHEKAEAILSLRHEQPAENLRLPGVMVPVHERIRLCEEQILSLRAVVERHEERSEMWLEAVKRKSDLLELLETMHGIRLESSEQDLVLKVMDPGMHLDPELKPLSLILHVTKDGKPQIQTDSTFFTPAEVLLEDQVTDVKTAILEMQSAYRSQARLFQELQGLQDKFPIDWRPKERKLLYLKGSTICVLFIELGYPTSGAIRLLSLQGHVGSLDVQLLKPPYASPTLCNWLVYLSTNSEI